MGSEVVMCKRQFANDANICAYPRSSQPMRLMPHTGSPQVGIWEHRTFCLQLSDRNSDQQKDGTKVKFTSLMRMFILSYYSPCSSVRPNPSVPSCQNVADRETNISVRVYLKKRHTRFV